MKRYLEVDFVKGLAVISMVIFHFFYMGVQMNKVDYDTHNGILHLMARFAHLTFIFMVGVNLVITRLNNKDKSVKEYRKKHYKRVLKMAMIAIAITLITYYLFPEKYIKFGIIHFVCVGILLLLPFVDRPDIIVIISVIIGVINSLNESGMLHPLYTYINSFIAFIFGIYNYEWAAMDHFAIFKFLPVMAGGIYQGHRLYNRDGRKIKMMNAIDKILTDSNIIVKIGRNSLPIYIVHFVLIYIYYKFVY